MKRLWFILGLCACAQAQSSLVMLGAGGGSASSACGAFSHCYSVVYDHTLVGSSDSSNFPALVYFSSANLKDTGHGGYVNSSAGADILFFSTSGISTQLASELDFYDNVNGIGWFWVEIGTLSHSANGTIYMAVGNASPPARTTTPWDANYVVVCHMNDNAANTTVLNSVGSNNGTATANTSTLSVAGDISRGMQFGGGPYVEFTGNPAALQVGKGSLTVELVYRATGNGGGYASPFGKSLGGMDYGLNFVSNGSAQGYWGFGNVENGGFTASEPQYDIGTPHYLAITRFGSSDYYTAEPKMYLDSWGLVLQLNGWNNIGSDSGGNLRVGASLWDGTNFTGIISEFRVSNIVRAADWIKAEYNNQNAPGNIGAAAFWTWTVIQ